MLIKITELFYVVYTLYTLIVVSISDYPIVYALTGVGAIWLLYFMFWLGYRSFPKYTHCNVQRNEKNKNFFEDICEWKTSNYIMNVIITWICSILAAKYYTGKSITQVFAGIRGGNSAYMEYQTYFANANISQFSISKIPYVLMLAYVTLSLFISVVILTQGKKELSKKHIFYIILIIMAEEYFGIARGTNFETFMVFILVAYCVLLRNKNKNIDYKKILIVGILGIVMVTIFLNVVSKRGYDFGYEICGEINYLPRKWGSQFLGPLVKSITPLFGYLGFGIYTIGKTLFDIIPENIFSFIVAFIPGNSFLFGLNLPLKLRETIDMGARWCPDYITLINLVGIVLFYNLAIMMGRFLAKLEYKYFFINSPLVEVIKSLLFIELLSIPVGNFLVASTSNEIFVMLVIIRFIYLRYSVKWRIR